MVENEFVDNVWCPYCEREVKAKVDKLWKIYICVKCGEEIDEYNGQ